MAARKPTAILKINGGFRKDRHGVRGDVAPPPGVPEKPSDLSEPAGWLWDQVVPGLVEMGVVGRLDTPELVEMCRWYGRYRRCAEVMDGADLSDKGSYRIVIQTSMTWQRFESIASRFGLTPIDRSKLQAPKAQPSSSKGSYFDRKKA
jgi:P27 family predicted phage terminase small subunit